MNSVLMTHRQTGIVETRQSREKASNARNAKAAILARLDDALRTSAASRTTHVGSDMGGDKSATFRLQDDRVTHHATDTEMSAVRYMEGFMDEAW